MNERLFTCQLYNYFGIDQSINYANLIMQQIFDLLACKLKIIQKIDIHKLSNQEKDQLLEFLMVEKKKESLRILHQTRLQQTVNLKNVNQEHDLIYVLNRSLQAMNIYDPELAITQNENRLEAIIELYKSFFIRQGFSNRAQEIENMYKRKLCPKSLIPSTLCNWLVQWVRKQFNEYLKTNIHSLYVNSRQTVHSMNKSAKPAKKDKEELSDQKFLIIRQKPTTHFKGTNLGNVDQEKELTQNSHLHNQKWKVNSASPSIRQNRSGSLTSILQADIPEHQDSFPINKEVFYYAYSQEIQTIYKNLQHVLPDLDINFVRHLKRGGRRKEVKKRIKEVAKNIIRHMQYIEQSITKYYNEYSLGHQIKKKSKRLPPSVKKQFQDKVIVCSEVNTSQSNRNHVPQLSEIAIKRKQLISSLSRKHRYTNSNGCQDSNTSYLLRTAEGERAYQQNRFKTLDLSIGSQSESIHKRSKKIIILNHPKVSSSLEIIQQTTRKMHLRSNTKQIKSLSRKKQFKKEQLRYNSIDLTYNNMQKQDYQNSSIQWQTSKSPQLHLPKIKGSK